jgi:murein tripeptide amidase MpaA
MRTSGFAAAAAVLVLVAAAPAQAAPTTYRVEDVRTAKQRAAVARTGAAIVEVDHGSVKVTASRSDLRALRRAGFKVVSTARKTDFPAADAAYHNYAELTQETLNVANAFPSLVRRSSIGNSYQSRALWMAKVSDNVATDEAEPEVLFTCGQHAREHLTIEMCLYLLNELTSKYATDAKIRELVDSREIWIIFNLNPDGAEYDIATGSYRSWRKNRQPNGTSSSVGTDLNRNWSFQWGCCGGSSSSFSSETYRGASAFSAPETQRVRDFVNSRVVGGVQQIKAHIDFHTYSELILWPYGYTTANTAPGLTADDQAMLSTLGRNMAATNGYTPEQASDLYIADGTIDDWAWGVHKIASYTFEMYPRSSSPGFYPPASVISREVSRNRAAVIQFLDAADCVYEVIGKQQQYCGVAPPPTVYFDNFETANGWTVNFNGTDTATTGRFERANPAATNSGGAKQLGTTFSGSNDLVTGAAAGTSAGDFDIDGGVTSVTSGPITLPAGNPALSFQYYFAHGSNATSADFLRVSVVGATTVTVLNQTGTATNRNGAWTAGGGSLANLAGQTVRIRIEAADASTASLVEAGVDDVRITG